MKETPSKMHCPECGHNININELVFAQISDEIRKDLSRKAEEDRVRLESSIRKILTEEKESELQIYKQELDRKSEQVKDLNKTRIELEQSKRSMAELRSTIEAETEAKMSSALSLEKERLHSEYDEKNNLKILEKESLIGSLKGEIESLNRKLTQGSMQLQGEAQEMAIEDYLKINFPLDNIIEIKKGAKGADCLQEVNSREVSDCGSILYESKNTQAWSGSWIEKFKGDMLMKKAQFGVLVTQVYPTGVTEMSLIEGVWVCNLKEFRGLSHVLRESLILLKTADLSQENKGDKMKMLYDYLTSNEFRLQVGSIVEGFTSMQDDLTSEKRAMESLWKKRQKQIDKVLLNTTHLFGSIKGIAGSAIPGIKLLELPNNRVE